MFLCPDVDDEEDDDDEDLLNEGGDEEHAKGDDEGDVPMEGAEATGDRQGFAAMGGVDHPPRGQEVAWLKDVFGTYYPDAEEVYGDAEALVQMEDTQPLTEPIITPDLLEKKMPDTTFDFNFLAAMMDKPNLVRNICFLGAMHHGKTTFMDLLVLNTHEKDWKVGKEIRSSDESRPPGKRPPGDA
eukprot:Skav220725  [mRNA]  locus=scaffold2753:105376:108461:- [translate_table: standard]